MTSALAPLLQATDLRKRYRLRGIGGAVREIVAVDDVSIDVLPGETLSIVGESGCGKSTLARLVMQLEVPDEGQVRFAGRLIDTRTRTAELAFRRDVQMIFQDPYGSLTPHFRVGTLVAEPLRIHHAASGSDVGSRVAELLGSVGLATEIADRFPHELSGGQRQRVNIARAIATRPKLLICDEPVSALDVSVRSQILNLLLDLQANLSLSYIFISHDLGLVDHISDHVAVMYLGRIVEAAPAALFFSAPRHPYSRALIASTPVPDPSVRIRAVVQGEIGSSEPLIGCRFRNRCPLAVDRCAATAPQLRVLADRHLVACHRAEEL